MDIACKSVVILKHILNHLENIFFSLYKKRQKNLSSFVLASLILIF